MEKRLILIALTLLAFSTIGVSAQEEYLGSFEYEDGMYWSREYTDGSLDNNISFTIYELSVPTEGTVEFRVTTEYDDTNDPAIPGSFLPLPHGVELLVGIPGPGEDPMLDAVWLAEEQDVYTVNTGRVVVAVYPTEYFIGGLLDEAEGPNYDETTFEYLNVWGNVFYTFTPSGGTMPPLEPDIIDHIICGGISEDFTPLDIKNSFKENEEVYSVLNLADVNTGDLVTWVYSGPNEVTEMQSLEIVDGGEVTAYSVLDLNDYDGPYGEWIVSIDINGNLMRVDTFIVEGRTGVGIPIPGWTAVLGLGIGLALCRKRD